MSKIDLILSRKSVRAYTSEPVSEEDIETMLRAAMAAPSSKNRQPWEFIVVTDRKMLDYMAENLKHARMLAAAPLAIVVCSHKMMTLQDGSVDENKFWQQDAAAAIENLLLAAEALGLGAVWTAAAPDPVRGGFVKETLGVPDGVEAVCVIPVGHPAGDNAPKDKWKPEKIHRDRW